MVLMNKAVLSSFGFNAPISMLLFQCVVCVVLVRLTAAAGWIRLEPFSLRIVRLWLPVNIIFVGEHPKSCRDIPYLQLLLDGLTCSYLLGCTSGTPQTLREFIV